MRKYLLWILLKDTDNIQHMEVTLSWKSMLLHVHPSEMQTVLSKKYTTFLYIYIWILAQRRK